jgi:dTMP kinase
MIVLADRYIYTAFARDAVRGVDREWLRDMYGFAIKPNLAFYFKVPTDISVKRILTGRPELKYYEAGMDLGLHDNPVESFKIFQGRILDEYDRLSAEYGLHVVDATGTINAQQLLVRKMAESVLTDYVPEPVI